ncbi:MAG: tyrosine-type recombinase/integrase [Muribaculaceae bacterium]|nr:tyrosine-type recombinase/integrase [Muribaculaceae bacterium]
MKEKIIEMVMNGMIDCLTGAQLERLQGVLHITLQGVDVSSVCYDEQVNHDNEVLLASFLSAKSIEGCSGKTIAYYRMTISRFLNLIEKDLRLVCTDDIRSYLTMYQQEHGSSMVTIDNMRRIFSSFFSWLEDEDYIVKSPVRRIHKVRTEKLVKETISDEQLETLRDSCEEMRDLAMIDFLASTGVRVGELVKINRDDIDFHERQCVVLGKGNKERTVYFNARAKVHLQKYLAERDDDNEALFVRLNGMHERMSIGGIEARMRWLGSQAEVCRIHPHKFRRTMATVAIDKGMPIEQVQRLLGHKKIDTTLHYAMVNQNNVKIAHRKYIS